MDYAAASDALVAAAWALGVACTALTAAMVLAMFVARWRLAIRDARRRRLVGHWRPRLLDAMTGDATLAGTSVPVSERVAFVDTWLRLQRVVRGDSRTALDRALVDTGLDIVCRRWLRVPRPANRRLLAALAIGRLGATEDWARLAPLLDASPTWLALAALQGTMRIDPARAAGPVLERLATRPPWPRDLVRAAFLEAGPDAVTAPLLAWMRSAPPAVLAHWLPLLRTADPGATQSALAALLSPERPKNVLAAALRQVDRPQLLAAVRVLADHPAWEVRTQVASTLGRVGGPGDRDALVRLLGDAHWWVRHRAARSLVALADRGSAPLPVLLARLVDGPARDALRDVAAEDWLLPDTPA